MHAILIGISSILNSIAIVPYLIDVIRGRTKPRIVSWFIWSLITGIAGLASVVDRQYAAAILLMLGSLIWSMVVIFGWKHGDRRFETIDILCLIGALIGLVFLLVLRSPSWAVITTIAVDAVGSIPTVIHAWKEPHEETLITYTLIGLACICTLFAASEVSITAVAYPAYLVALNILLNGILITRRKYAVKRDHIELRSL
jgi:hypothetical protein